MKIDIVNQPELVEKPYKIEIMGSGERKGRVVNVPRFNVSKLRDRALVVVTNVGYDPEKMRRGRGL